MDVKLSRYSYSATVDGTEYIIRDGIVSRGIHHYDGYKRKAYDQYEIIGRHYPCHFKDRAEARKFLAEASAVFNTWRRRDRSKYYV